MHGGLLRLWGMRHNMTPITESIPVIIDPFEIVSALCDADEWDLALRIARQEDVKAMASQRSAS
jgi:hypothetical protein